MRPYGTPFIPTGVYSIIWADQFSAYVDVNGNGSYEPATDYLVVLSSHTITVTRTVSPSGAVEGQDAGYRLILQSPLIQNPDGAGDTPSPQRYRQTARARGAGP